MVLYIGVMSSKCDLKPKRERIDVQFPTLEEQAEYRRFLEETGRKAGPYVLSLIKADMRREKARNRRSA